MTSFDPSRLVLGVDVGNSKTHVALADRDGTVVAAKQGTGIISGGHDEEALLVHVLDLVEQLVGVRGGFASAAFAMAGLDLPKQEADMRRRVDGAAVADRVSVVNDTFAVLRAGTGTGDGIAVVVGAGINCIGVRGNDVVRFLSGGRVSGDWGGGFDVGIEALALACRGEDGRGDRTALEGSVAAHFGASSALAVAEAVMAGELAEHRLAELAPIVFQESREGDGVARRIVEHLADEVAHLVRAALNRLCSAPRATGPTPVILGGGLMRAADPVLHTRLFVTLATLHDDIELRVQDEHPVVGSLLIAFDQLGAPPPRSSAQLGQGVAAHL